ncbi:hypothetical protein [Halobacteriovorax sp. RT-1-4]|uniref:hypothetical protein n=1 Tax=unclassified Halobacteriovorax TaxID=2639665 RepID=UPI00399B6E36
MKKILFLGLGHLGQHFLSQNKIHEVIGTRRKSDELETNLIEFSLGESWKASKDFDVIIISFPPVEEYSLKLQKLLDDLRPLNKVIFISSTSVFGTGQINEDSMKVGHTRNAKELIECEKLISQLDDYVIVRPGGLIDSKRHPKFFSKKMSKLSKSKTNVNLVHTSDVAAFLHYAIGHNISNEDFNLVCDDHPTKEEFYRSFNSTISFDSENSELRIIDNSKSKNTGFTYHYSNLSWSKL